MRRLYARDHLDQVLATFALILIFSEATRWVFGSFPLYLNIPRALSGPVDPALRHPVPALPARPSSPSAAWSRSGSICSSPARASASRSGPANLTAR